MNEYYVYIMTNPWHTLYVGITRNLVLRTYEHKQKLIPGFTARYNLAKLVYYEATSDVDAAIAREKQIKGWLRKRKIALIESMNPRWEDLSLAWGDGVAKTLHYSQGDMKNRDQDDIKNGQTEVQA
jgi:putative endonuclease